MTNQPELQHLTIPVTVRQPSELARNFTLHAAVVPAEDAEQAADVVAYGGLGFNGGLPALTAERAAAHDGGRGIIVVEAPNYAKTEKTPKDLIKKLTDDPDISWEDLFSDRLETFGAQQVNGVYDWLINEGKITPDAHTIGESQAAEAITKAALEDAEKMRGMLVLMRAMGGVVLNHRAKLIGGLLRSAPETFFDKATSEITVHSAGQFMADMRRYRGQMSKYVIDSSVWPDALRVTETQPQRPVHVVVSPKDRLEPAKGQYAAASAAQGPDSDALTKNFYEIGKGHISIGTKPGAQQLAQVAQHARGVETLRPYAPAIPGQHRHIK